MPNQISQAVGDASKAVAWVHIDDFSAGLYNGSYISNADPTTTAPLGACAPDGTFACAAIISGSLGPLPARTQANSYPVSFPGSATQLYETGFAANLGLDDGTTELIIMLEADDGTNHYYLVYSVIAETGSAVPIISTTNSTTGSGIFGAAFPSWTRVSTQPVEGQSGYVLPTPTLVWPAAVATDANADRGHVYLYPDPTDPTAFQAFDMVSPTPGDSAVAGAVFCYGDRVVVFQGQGAAWPVGGGVNTNENVGVTDPPQGNVYPADFDSSPDIPNATILAAEAPWGYAAWGSVSVGEAILIKKNGGAVQVNGDMLAPTSIIPLPGVQPVGGDGLGLACATSIGLVYCSMDRGAWVWNGGNVAQKISPQLDDDFFNPATAGAVFPNNNYLFLAERWQDWIIFSNNYLYNSDNGSWWILYPNEGQTSSDLQPITMFWWKQGRAGNVMWSSQLVLDSSDPSADIYYNKFDSEIPSAHWQWQSVPMHVNPNADRVVDVVQVILRLSAVSPGATATWSITGPNGTATGTTGVIPAAATTPSTYRFNVGQGGLGLSDIVITINGDTTGGTGYTAPILHSVDIGFTTRSLQAEAD